MKLITLGTSHGDPTDIRFNSSNLLEVENNQYIIDAGVPVNALFIKKNTNKFSRVKAIFITHMHDDHVGGLPSFIKSLIKYPAGNQHTDIFLPEDAEKEIRAWLGAMHLSGFDKLLTFHKVKEGFVYDDGVVKVTAYGTKHIPSDGEPITFSYVFEHAGKRMLYTGDLAMDFEDFPERAIEDGLNLCVCECTHYPSALAVEKLSRDDVMQIVFNHVGGRWSTPEGEKRLLRQFEGRYNGICSVAHDGDEFEIAETQERGNQTL